MSPIEVHDDASATYVGLDEVRPVRHEVPHVRHVPALLDPDKVLDWVEALLQARGRQEVLHRHGVAQVESHELKKNSLLFLSFVHDSAFKVFLSPPIISFRTWQD